MTQYFTGMSALVTGGAVRIGRAIVLELAARGADVVIHYRRSEDAAHALAAEVQAMGRGAWIVPADLADVQACEALMATAWRMAGGLSILVNNAAVFDRRPLAACEAGDFQNQWQINALAPMLLTQSFARRHAATGEAGVGRVVNLLDRRVATQEAGCLPYLVSKKALQAFTESAAIELAPGLTLNAVAPGAVLPPPAGTMSEAAGAAPLKAPCTPQAVAQAVCWLAANRVVTGQTLFVDAGQHLVNPET